MTRKEINQIYYYNKQIEKLTQDLIDIESGTYRSPQLDGIPRGASGKSDPTGTAGTSAADIKTLIEEYRYKIERKRREVYEYISELDDALVELIILYRCINLCTWDQVAAHIGGGNTADSVRMIFNRHFEE